MKRRTKVLMVLAILIFACQNMCFADDAFRKFGRGMANTIFGWVEIFTITTEECEQRGYFPGLLYGIPQGVVKGVWRTVVGIYEATTFPIPIPRYYEPITDPEFAIETSIFE